MLIRVNTFPGILSLPGLVATHRGFFEAEGLTVETSVTASSEAQRRALVAGECDIAHAAVDNALALRAAGHDAIVVLGLDSGFNRIVARPHIGMLEDLRGGVLGVDAPDTAFALLAYEVLEHRGLRRERDYAVRPVGATNFRLKALEAGEIDAALLNLPFNLQARNAGLRLLDDPLDTVVDYQATGGFVLRARAERITAALDRYVRAYVASVDWILASANSEAVRALIAERLGVSDAMAAECHALVADPDRGFQPGARPSEAGIATVLRLRHGFAAGEPGVPASRDAFLDPAFLDRATVAARDRAAR